MRFSRLSTESPYWKRNTTHQELIGGLLGSGLRAHARHLPAQHKWINSTAGKRRSGLNRSSMTEAGLELSRLSGEWQRTMIAVRSDEYNVQFQFASVTLEGNRRKNVEANELRLAQERLTKPFWVTCGNDGSPRVIHFTKDVHLLTATCCS